MSDLKQFSPPYTVKDYQSWQGDWELWAGVPVSMSPGPFGKHQRVARNLVQEFTRALSASKCNAEVLYELDWIVNDDTVVRPDVVVICGQGPERYLQTSPAVVAEVISESTEQRDRTFKRELYREQNVEAYLLLDPDNGLLEIDWKDEEGNWQTYQVSEPVTLNLCSDCQIVIDPAVLFET